MLAVSLVLLSEQVIISPATERVFCLCSLIFVGSYCIFNLCRKQIANISGKAVCVML